MKKRTLIILLVIPFILSLLTFVSIKILDNAVAVDILGIRWDYNENEGFKVSDTPYELKATAITDPDKILAKGNNLVWSMEETSADIGEIEKDDDGNFYFLATNEGNVEITCSNERGTVSKHFMATVFEDGAMIINPLRKGSGSSITSNKYYGLYDLNYTEVRNDSYEKKKSSFSLTTVTYLEDGSRKTNNSLKECSSNVSYQNGVVSLKSAGKAYVTLEESGSGLYSTYEFTIIDGVNIYNYNDLLMATNFSTTGENAVMQTSLTSLSDLYKKDDKGNYINELKESVDSETENLFGNYDFNKKTFSFDKEYYVFETTYDTRYIDYYNEDKSENEKYSKNLIAAIHLKKNLYGNGFLINMNNLCYPNHGSIGKDGKLTPDKEKDYFHGPLPFVTIGDLGSTPLIEALGQDNSGIYIDSDNVTLDDIRIMNVNEVDNLYNLTYTGSVIDIKGKNVTISNSVIANGKVCVRAFDSDNLLIDNSILKNAGEFVMMVGSDSYSSYDTSKTVSETFSDGSNVSSSFSSFFDTADSGADKVLNDFVNATIDGKLQERDYASDVEKVQSYLDNTNKSTSYAATINIKDTFFGRSGVFALASESMFNGPLLYGNIPSSIVSLLNMLKSKLPNKNGGTSDPVKVNLIGDTRFYDWKNIESIDVSSLINENISTILQSLDMGDKTVTIDDIFPMKTILEEVASNKGLVYKDSTGKKYINTSIAYYGGGLNVSVIENQTTSSYNTYSEELNVSLLDRVINSNGSGMRAMLVDCVVVTIGSHDFRFVINGKEESSNPILLEESPKNEDLKKNYKNQTEEQP